MTVLYPARDRRQGGREDSTAVRSMFAAFVVAALTALMAVIVLSATSMPPDGRTRLDQVEADLAALGDAGGKRLLRPTYQAGAICDSPASAGDMLRQRLSRAAAAEELTLSGLTVTRAAPNAASGLTPVEFSFASTGRYDRLVLFLQSLARSQPEVFVDSADLTPQTSVVALQLTGRILCWTSGRQ